MKAVLCLGTYGIEELYRESKTDLFDTSLKIQFVTSDIT